MARCRAGDSEAVRARDEFFDLMVGLSSVCRGLSSVARVPARRARIHPSPREPDAGVQALVTTPGELC
jgi:hypothetical protein